MLTQKLISPCWLPQMNQPALLLSLSVRNLGSFQTILYCSGSGSGSGRIDSAIRMNSSDSLIAI
jgi:hypothetical protein